MKKHLSTVVLSYWHMPLRFSKRDEPFHLLPTLAAGTIGFVKGAEGVHLDP
jgi:hypothetical protein